MHHLEGPAAARRSAHRLLELVLENNDLVVCLISSNACASSGSMKVSMGLMFVLMCVYAFR